MKYSENNKPIICTMKNSSCYKETTTMKIKGVLWHSTGANNPSIKRYVQPNSKNQYYSNLIKIIGKNSARNDWNHIPMEAGVNAWIGKLANGTVATVQTLPWNYKPWGCAAGPKGSCNNGWIQFEICEDNLKSKTYFNKVYKEACELTAYLCKKYDINPYDTVKMNGADIPTILCHQDSYQLGVGSNHGDVLHWFKRYGKTMQDVRNDVADLMKIEPKGKEVFYQVKVVSSSLKTRKRPFSSSEQVSALKKNDIVNIISEFNNFGKIEETGSWINLNDTYVKKVEKFTVKVISASLKIRAKANSLSKQIGSLKKGDVKKIIDVQGKFGRLSDKSGWINLDSKYVEKE